VALIAFDNIIFSLQRSGGVSRFWSMIIKPYIGDAHTIFMEKYDFNKNMYRQDMDVTPVFRDRWQFIPSRVAQYFNVNLRFFDDEFVFHSSYFRVNKVGGCKNVTTVHDLMYEKFGSGIGKNLHLRQKEDALRQSDVIVCVSEHTRKDLYYHYPFCEDKRVLIIPNGVDDFNRLQLEQGLFDKFDIGLTKPYFIYIGHRGKYKGFDLIHDVLDIVEGELQCVVVGNPFTTNELETIFQRGHQNQIINIGKVSDYELNQLYCQAYFLFFPSLYEGFGIPPLEAMSSGCPVLASNRSSVPEVIGDAGILFDPSDIFTLKEGLLRIHQSDIRDQLIYLGIKRSKKYSWNFATEAYAKLYNEILEEG